MNPNLIRVATHAAGAAAFFFVLQHYIMHETVETSLLWAGSLAVAAALLAWSQTRR